MRHEDGVRIERIADPRPRARRIARKGDGKSGGAGSGGTTTPHQPVDSPNTLRSIATARILEVLSEGVVAGMHTAAIGGLFWNSVYLDGTPLVDAAGNWQFRISQGDFRYGYPSQDWISGYSQSEAEITVGVQTTYAVPIVRSLSDTNITSVRYLLTIPALYFQEQNGDVNQSSVAYAFDVSIDGGMWTNYVTERIFGKCMSPYQRSVRVTLRTPITSTCEIRVERIDLDNVSGNSNLLSWASYTEIVDGQLSYDDTCIISMAVDAEQFPNVPQRAYLLDGIMVDIPTNYNGRTHGYSGDWNGSFYVQWTNNPAWILYGLLTNERWGLGRDLDVASIDKWSFYDAAVWNDRGAPNTVGGYEVGWTCNCVINTRQDAWQVLTAVASSMLGSLYFANGTVYLVQDRQVYSPSRLFAPADVENGLFDYTGTDYRSRYNAVAVTWIDPSQQYTPAVELVQDPTLVAQQGYRDTTMNAFGCTSQAQARRMGRWLIYTSQYETEVVSFIIGLENADLRPGDVVAINDPGRAGARTGGRLLEDNGANTLTLDSVDDALRNNSYYEILVTAGSAADPAPPYTGVQIVRMPIVHVPPTGNQITVSGKPGPLSLPPGSMFLAHSGQVEPTWWRIASISDQGGGKYQVLATYFTQEKFDYIDRAILAPPPSFSLIPSGPLQGPTNVTDTEYIYLDGAGWPQFGVIVSWTPSVDPRVAYYQMEMSGPNGDYRMFRQIVGVQQDVPLMRQGLWTVSIRAFDNIGRRSAAVVYTFLPVGLSAPPLAPLGLFIAPQGGNLSTLTWIPTGEIDVVYYWVTWAPQTDGSATWDRATTSIARVDRNTLQVSVPTRAGTYMVKSIDALGQESVEWAEAILMPQQTETTIVLSQYEQPTWSGALGTNWHHNRNELWMPPPSAAEPVPPDTFPGERGLALNATPTRTGVYDFRAMPFDLGASTLVVLTAITLGYATILGTTMDKWQPLASAQPLATGANYSMSSWIPLAKAVPLAMGSSRNWDAHIEASVSTDGVTYQPWFPLKSSVITMRSAKFRLVGTLYDLQSTLAMQQTGVIINVPLRNVQGSDVAVDSGGHLVVTYVAPFLVTPTVQITARQSLSPGGNIVITESDRNHFKIENRNAAGAAVAGASIDYFVQGYGGHA